MKIFKTVAIFSLLAVSLSANAQNNTNLDKPQEINNSNSNISSSIISDGMNYSDVMNAYENKVKTIKLKEDIKDKIIEQISNSHPENQFKKSQFFVVADRNPKNQVATIAYWDNDNQSIELANFTHISTGSVRKGHFYTPVGWFQNLPANGSYRAEGTKNSNGIRGYGRKGMRVWDFGWVPSSSGAVKGLDINIRFQMHATDPDYLESRLGRPDSKGCVRVHSSMNEFLDKYGIIDEEYENIKSWVLKKDRIKIQNPGTYLLVVDTEDSKL